MTSQQEVIELTPSQEKVYRQLAGLDEETSLSEFSRDVLQCSTYKLDITHIQTIDSGLLNYSNYILQKVKIYIESKEVLQVTSELLLSLAAYHDSLKGFNSSSALLLSDVIGFLLLSGKLVQTVLSKMVEQVTCSKPSQPVELLKALWKSLNDFIMNLVGLVDKYHSCDSYTSLCSSIRELVLSLAHASKELAVVENKTMAHVYKCTLRLMTKDDEHRSNGVLADVAECVCNTISFKYTQYNTQQYNTQRNHPLAKVIVFLLKILSKLVTFVTEEAVVQWSSVTDVVLTVSTAMTDLLYGGTQSDANLDAGLRSLLNSCLQHKSFQHSLFDHELKPTNSEQVLYIVSTIHECMASCVEMYSHWWSDEYMSRLSHLLSLCGNELCLINPKRNKKTAYEFVLARLAAMVVTVPAGEAFQCVEKLLLHLLLSPAVHVNLLATDCWHFLARYSSGRLPFVHCCKLLDMLNDHRLSDRQVYSVQHLIDRLVGVMPADLQIDLAKYTNAFDSGVLANATFHEQAQRHVESGGTKSLNKHLEVIRTSRRAQGELLHSLKAIARLLSIPYKENGAERLSQQAANQLTDILIANPHNTSLDHCVSLTIGSYASRRKLHPQLLKLLHSLYSAFTDRSLCLQTKMLSSLGHLSTLPTAQDKKLVIQLYQQSVTSHNITLRLHALESFEMFAKTTPYRELISEIAAHSSDVNDRIVRYCSGQTKGSTQTFQSWDLSHLPLTDNMSHEPVVKRQRIDADEIISRLKELVEQLQHCGQLSIAQQKELGHVSSDLSYIVDDMT